MTEDIRIGNQTAFSAAYTLQPLEFAIAQGFRAFEWFSDKKRHPDGSSDGWDEDDMDAGQRSHIRQLGEQHDIRYTVHAPWQANPLQAGAEALLKRSIDFARDIGADLVNLHLYMEQGPQGYAHALAPVIAYAAERQVRISIENTPLTGPADFNHSFDSLKGLAGGIEHLGMCLDIGHANLFAGTHNDFIRYIDALDSELPIIHLHVHENWGDSDSHLTLFTGPAADNDRGIRAFIERMQRRDYRGAMIMEQWPQPPQLLSDTEQHLQRLIAQTGQAPTRNNRQPRSEPAANEEPDPEPVAIAAVELPASERALIADIARAHQSHLSWRQRLRWIEALVTNPEFSANPEQLALLAIYLRFLGTGELLCEEDGRHFRPNHHARAALAIEARLEQITAPRAGWILRKIYPWLPSYSATFQRSEPLTRIRDIAHRNDIPQPLKREIKQRLQNKLHRCAGPEDLETSRELLERVTNQEADYSPGFIEQFRIFHQELSEFFNAASLEQRLTRLLPSLERRHAQRVRRFLDLKHQRDDSDATLLELLDQLTGLRQCCVELLAGADAETAQQLRLTDIGLEDYAFTLLSEAANRCALKDDSSSWQRLLRALMSALTHIGLSQLEAQESAIVVSELEAWSRNFSPADRFQLRRLKASLERAGRIADHYSAQVLNLFPPRVNALGQALGVEQQAIRVFSEGDIRGNVVFQLTRLLETAQQEIRTRLQLPPWDSIGAGQAQAKLIRRQSLATLSDAEQPLILLLDQAEGDEEIPINVRGILLAHPIPHLSHLGVRARQAGIPFAGTEQPDPFKPFQPYLNQTVVLQVGREIVSLEPATGASNPARTRSAPAPARLPLTSVEGPGTTIPLLQATATSCGAKAATAADLLRLAERSKGLFQAPKGLVLPFAAMQWSLSRVPEQAQRYRTITRNLHPADRNRSDSDLNSLREILLGLPINPDIGARIRNLCGDTARLAVRSSANGEDLENLASAGLYDSVIGVSAADCPAAIGQVWASLWNRRAFMSRQQNGIPHAVIHMAVLIQELLEPELSFVMHSADPVTGDGHRCWVELAVGLGETLVSAAQPGNAYRLICDRHTGKVELTACASFSMALQPLPGTGIGKSRVDYSHIPLSVDPKRAQRLGKQLGRIATALEEAFDGPQDAEGVIVGEEIYLVQTRPQQGVGD